MTDFDDELARFEAVGTPVLPEPAEHGYVEHEGARIRYCVHGTGAPVILLHGGFGHGGNWANQVPALLEKGYSAILIDSRGHGRSTRDSRPFTYELMASDVLEVMNALSLEKAALVGWSDGAVISLILGMKHPNRVNGVFYFGCNMDPGGLREVVEPAPILDRCLSRHRKDYARLSSTPERFGELLEAVGLMMRTQPNYSAEDLGRIQVQVLIVQSEDDEFIKREHAEYLARSIPGAGLEILTGVSHFAPLQRPDLFNQAVLAFLSRTSFTAPQSK